MELDDARIEKRTGSVAYRASWISGVWRKFSAGSLSLKNQSRMAVITANATKPMEVLAPAQITGKLAPSITITQRKVCNFNYFGPYSGSKWPTLAENFSYRPVGGMSLVTNT